VTWFWSRLTGGIAVLSGIVALQVARITDDYSNDPAGAAIQYVILALILPAVFGAVVVISFGRSSDARARRASLSVNPATRWIADVTIDSGSLAALVARGHGAAVPEQQPTNFALAVGPDSLQVWAGAQDPCPVVDLPFAQIADVDTSPLVGTAKWEGEFGLTLMGDPDSNVTFRLVNPVLFGAYPSTPSQVRAAMVRLASAMDPGGTSTAIPS
jgi:hypothetical protein